MQRLKLFTNACKIKLLLRNYSEVQALRSKKSKSSACKTQYFVDFKHIRAIGGKGGDGCISFLHLWANEHAGPDGADGGNGGHVIFSATNEVTDLNHVHSLLKADTGGNGANKDCNGKNADHLIIKVPVGTLIKNNDNKVVGDLPEEGIMFVAARGGAGGKGNHFFITDTEQSPEICEYGAHGEDLEYSIEIQSMAHVGLIGLPNAGKSSLLRAVSRARPKVAPYPFTTLKPHIGMVQYDDYEQIAVADLPGLIEDSHKNKGLGIQFLRHAERCQALLFIIDCSEVEPWNQLNMLQYEISQFSETLIERPQLVIANKIDLPASIENFKNLGKHTDLPIIAISAKLGTNISELLRQIRLLYDKNKDI